MNRYLYRVQYAYADGRGPIAGVTYSYEPVCVRAATAAAALAEVETATDRYVAVAGVTRAITLTLTVAE